MSIRVNWSDLEQRGLIPPTPGRAEAAAATQKKVAAKKAAQAAERATVNPASNRK